jgi:uncharacterized damage-inducible protein DinB
MHAGEMLTEPIIYLAPAKALDGLTPEQAERHVSGATHSIAQVLAHVMFWQEWFRMRCEGQAVPMVTTAAAGWPEVASGSWPALHERFLTSLDRVVAFDAEGRLDDPIAPPIEFPPLAQFTIRDAVVHIAMHNAHHLGQIILLRQMLGLWPPPAGSWTW